MTVIDVNTGKYIGKRDLQETILKTNLEAAEEIARQVRLRDIGGIILIDFIDMGKKEHQKMVMNVFEQFLSYDRTRSSVVEMSELGLVEMTRKRVRKNLDAILCEPCNYCQGEGRVLSIETTAINFLRVIEEICRHSQSATISFTVGQELGEYLKNNGKIFLNNIKKIYNKELIWKIDPNLSLRRYSIVKVNEDEVQESINKVD